MVLVIEGKGRWSGRAAIERAESLAAPLALPCDGTRVSLPRSRPLGVYPISRRPVNPTGPLSRRLATRRPAGENPAGRTLCGFSRPACLVGPGQLGYFPASLERTRGRARSRLGLGWVGSGAGSRGQGQGRSGESQGGDDAD